MYWVINTLLSIKIQSNRYKLFKNIQFYKEVKL